MAPGAAQTRGPSSRSKAACRYCRDRHGKCDQAQPCRACRRIGIECDYDTKVLFDAVQWQPRETSDGSPVRAAHISSPALLYTFMDETISVANHYHVVNSNEIMDSRPLGFPDDAPVASSSLQVTDGRHSRNDIHDSPKIDAPHGGHGGSAENLTELANVCLLSGTSPQSVHGHFISAGEPLAEPNEAFFFGRYADIIGPWFDLFDGSSQHFSIAVPQLASSNRLLLLACIAASSRQHALVTSYGRSDSLSYYNQAIRLLYERLGEQDEPDPATFASCLLIAHCEMVESQAGDWNLHLRGARELVAIHGWNGISGGLGQACFWIFCRMIILSCLSSSTSTPVPTRSWVPSSPAIAATAADPPSWTLPAWANETVHLLGEIHNFLVSSRETLANDATPRTLATLTSDWDVLRTRLDQHDAQRPSICRPLSILPALPTDSAPFSSVRYVNGNVAAARQMFHTAVLLLHLSTPSVPSDKLATLSRSSVAVPALEAARKVVANSITNRSTVAWVNAVQLLTTAGGCLVEWRERKACATVLEDIQRVTGWMTEGNTDNLVKLWGWEGTQGGWRAVEGNAKIEQVGELLFKAWEGKTGGQLSGA